MKADEILVPFAEVLPVVATAEGEVTRGERRLASHNPKAPTAAPPEATDLTEQLAASIAKVESERAERPPLAVVPDPDPFADAILAATSDRDLELVWQRDRSGWRPEHLKLATERAAHLKREREHERPRAAMRAAIEGATTLPELTELMIARRDEPWMTRELFDLADRRFWTLRGGR
jgi:hypothetical protein